MGILTLYDINDDCDVVELRFVIYLTVKDLNFYVFLYCTYVGKSNYSCTKGENKNYLPEDLMGINPSTYLCPNM